VGVARAKSLLGPYEKNPANPIMTRNDKWRCPGHGTVVSTADGRDFFLYHAYDTKSFVFVGRQGLLDEVKWNANGWPTINDGKGPSIRAASPFAKAQRVDLEFADNFDASTLDPRWQWPHVREPNYELKQGQLILKSGSENGSDLFGSVLAVQTMTGDYAATVFIDGRETKPGAKTGLFAFGDAQNALGIVMSDGELQLVRRQRNKDDFMGSTKVPALDKIYLRMEAKEGHLFHFSVWNGTKWENVGPASDLEGQYLPPWDRGVRVALTVGGNPNAETKIEWLRVVPTLETARAN
jgi:beta-xylosidase